MLGCGRKMIKADKHVTYPQDSLIRKGGTYYYLILKEVLPLTRLRDNRARCHRPTYEDSWVK